MTVKQNVNLYQNHDNGDLHLITWRDLATSNTVFQTVAEGLANDKFISDLGFSYNYQNEKCDVDHMLQELANGLLRNGEDEPNYQQRTFLFQYSADSTRLTLDLQPENQNHIAFRLTLLQSNPYQTNDKGLRKVPTDNYSATANHDQDIQIGLEALYFHNGLKDQQNVQVICDSWNAIPFHESHKPIMRTIAEQLTTHMMELQYALNNPDKAQNNDVKSFIDKLCVSNDTNVLLDVREIFNQVQRVFDRKCYQYLKGKYFYYNNENQSEYDNITTKHQQELTHNKLLGQLLLSASKSLPDLLTSGYTPQTETNLNNCYQLCSRNEYVADNQLANGLLHLNMTLENNLQQLAGKSVATPIQAEVHYLNQDSQQLTVSFVSPSNPQWQTAYTLPINPNFMGENLAFMHMQQNDKSTLGQFKHFLREHVVPEQLKLLGVQQAQNDYADCLPVYQDLQTRIENHFGTSPFLPEESLIEFADFDDLVSEKISNVMQYKLFNDMVKHIMQHQPDMVEKLIEYDQAVELNLSRNTQCNNEPPKFTDEEIMMVALNHIFQQSLYQLNVNPFSQSIWIYDLQLSDDEPPMLYHFNSNDKIHLKHNQIICDTLLNDQKIQNWLNHKIEPQRQKLNI